MNVTTLYLLTIIVLVATIAWITVKLEIMDTQARHLARQVDWSQEARDMRSKIWDSEKRLKRLRAVGMVLLSVAIAAPLLAHTYGWFGM